MNKKGKASTGVVFLIVLGAIVLIYGFTAGWFGTIGGGTPTPSPTFPVGNCPSTGLTTVTVNTQQALATTATAAPVNYYLFDKDGILVANGNSDSSGKSSFTVKCGAGLAYKGLVINESTSSGYYPVQFDVDGSQSTDVHNLKVYTYGQVNLVNVVSSIDPLGTGNVSAGLGKTCGFTVTFTENETAAAFNKPLILCQVNVSSVQTVTMSGANSAHSLIPSRVTASAGYQYYGFQYPQLLKSTDSAVKIDGKIQFSATNTPTATDSMTCKIIDMATYKKANYQSMSLTDGFLESGQNDETLGDIGAPDSGTANLYFGHATGYC